MHGGKGLDGVGRVDFCVCVRVWLEGGGGGVWMFGKVGGLKLGVMRKCMIVRSDEHVRSGSNFVERC